MITLTEKLKLNKQSKVISSKDIDELSKYIYDNLLTRSGEYLTKTGKKQCMSLIKKWVEDNAVNTVEFRVSAFCANISDKIKYNHNIIKDDPDDMDKIIGTPEDRIKTSTIHTIKYNNKCYITINEKYNWIAFEASIESIYCIKKS